MPNHSPDHMRRITGASAAKRRATKLTRLIETSPPLHHEQVAQLCAALLDVQVDEEAARMRREQSNAAATTKPPRQPNLEFRIQQIVDFAPPLTPEQRDRLAVLLRGVDAQ